MMHEDSVLYIALDNNYNTLLACFYYTEGGCIQSMSFIIIIYFYQI